MYDKIWNNKKQNLEETFIGYTKEQLKNIYPSEHILERNLMEPSYLEQANKDEIEKLFMFDIVTNDKLNQYAILSISNNVINTNDCDESYTLSKLLRNDCINKKEITDIYEEYNEHVTQTKEDISIFEFIEEERFLDYNNINTDILNEKGESLIETIEPYQGTYVTFIDIERLEY